MSLKSLRSHEGYFMMDHRNSPGVPDAEVVRQGLIPGAGRGLFESATFTCPYCECVVVLNPDRSRPRNYDPATNHLICDGCEAIRKSGQPMKTMKQIADEILNQRAKQVGTTEAFQSPIIIP